MNREAGSWKPIIILSPTPRGRAAPESCWEYISALYLLGAHSCGRDRSLFFGHVGTKQQEIVVSRGKILELLRPDPNTGKVHTLLTVEVFGVIRSLMAFRLTGGTKDYIVVGSDSGRIVILEYQPSKNMFEKIHQETFGKSGCRRIVPGQFLAVDPKGRAVMISE